MREDLIPTPAEYESATAYDPSYGHPLSAYKWCTRMIQERDRGRLDGHYGDISRYHAADVLREVAEMHGVEVIEVIVKSYRLLICTTTGGMEIALLDQHDQFLSTTALTKAIFATVEELRDAQDEQSTPA